MLKFFKNNKIDYQLNLYNAIESRDFNCVKRAIRCGANIEIPNDDGNTALMEAILTEDYDLVEFFIISCGAKVIIYDGFGIIDVLNFTLTRNPFIDAEIVRLLLENGCNSNFRDEENGGVTPLMRAVAHNNVEVAQLLIDYYASVHYHDNNLYNVLDYASYKNIGDQFRCFAPKTLPNPECVKLILRHGGKIIRNPISKVSPTDVASSHKELYPIYNILKKAKNYRKKG